MVLFKNKFFFSILVLGSFILIYIVTKRYSEQYTSKFTDIEIYSAVLNENRKIFIRLPQHYDSNKKYPLIIKTDGNFNLERWHKTLTKETQEKRLDQAILVAIPNLFWQDSRNRDLVPPFARKEVNIEARPPEQNDPQIFGKADVFLSFIETELIPYLENNYPINSNRILSGFSAGGSMVLYTLVTKPDMFTGYFAFSPAAWYDNSIVVTEFKHNLPITKGSPKYLYLSLGEKENDIITGSFKGLLSALELKAPQNLIWEYNYSKGVGHNGNPFVSVPKALQGYHEFYHSYLSQ